MDFVITEVKAREILDSRGYPTVEAEVSLANGAGGRMMVPSGASTGKFEALELRDDEQRFRGKGVKRAVENVNTEIRNLLTGKDARHQRELDEAMIRLDGTANKSRLGANAILAVSLAVAHAAAAGLRQPLYRYLAEQYLAEPSRITLPVPMVNIISGGLHAGKNIDLQDFLIIPVGATSYPHALEMISDVYWKTQDILNKLGFNARLLADEGGFGPALTSNRQALDILCDVFVQCGYRPMEDMAIALDVAATHFYDHATHRYRLQSEDKALTTAEMIGMLVSWTKDYPVISIEDGLGEDDWEGWRELTRQLGNRIQLVGDDLFTTHPQRLRQGIELGAANAVLVKMNQIGTLTETVSAVEIAREAGFNTVISARSGETEDATLADLAVGLNGGQIKIGSLAGSSRLSKYNQLLRIHDEIEGRYPGRSAFRFLPSSVL